MTRELTYLEGLLVMVLLVAGICLTLACTGCTTTHHQQMYIGQAAYISTAYINNGRDDVNPSVSGMGDVLLTQVILIALVEIYAYIFPDHADSAYSTGAIMGYVPAANNVGVFIKDGIK